MMPPGAMPAARARVLIALLRVYARDGRATVGVVALEAGVVQSYAHRLLRELHDEGAVCYQPSTRGTLRPLVGAG